MWRHKSIEPVSLRPPGIDSSDLYGQARHRLQHSLHRPHPSPSREGALDDPWNGGGDDDVEDVNPVDGLAQCCGTSPAAKYPQIEDPFQEAEPCTTAHA